MSNSKLVEIEIVTRTDHTDIRMIQEFFDHDDIDAGETAAKAAAALGNAMARFVNPPAEV